MGQVTLSCPSFLSPSVLSFPCCEPAVCESVLANLSVVSFTHDTPESEHVAACHVGDDLSGAGCVCHAFIVSNPIRRVKEKFLEISA